MSPYRFLYTAVIPCCVLIPLSSWGASPSPTPPPSVSTPWKLSVRFDRSSYTLEEDAQGLVYKDSSRTHKIPAKACSLPVFNKVIGSYKTLLASYEAKPSSKKTEYDVEVEESGKSETSSRQIPRGSEFGTWLRELPKKIMYLEVEARAACRKK